MQDATTSKRGGFRPGAGRPKGGTARLHQVRMKAPADLAPAATLVWRRWSPLALKQRTLTRETAPAFALLCTAAAELAASLARRGGDPRATSRFCRLLFDGLTAFRLAPPPAVDDDA